jgi:hypothetical protein
MKTNASCPFHVHIFVDNNWEGEPVGKNVKDCDNRAKLHLKRWRKVVLFSVLFKV